MLNQIRSTANIYIALILRLGLIMSLYSISRVVFYLVNAQLFKEVTFAKMMVMMSGGLRFDLSAVLYINSLFIVAHLIPFRFRYKSLYQQYLKVWFWITNGFFLAANCADIIYYQFILKRTTASVFDNFANESNLGKLFLRFIFIDFWYISLFWLALVILMVWAYRFILIKDSVLKNNIAYYSSGTVVMLLLMGLTVGGLRGGFRHSTRPITVSNAGQYVERPKEMAIVLNTPFSVFRTLGKQSFKKRNDFEQDELVKHYNPLKTPTTDSAFIKKNVVVLILESFGKEYFGYYNKDLDNGEYKGYTPFLDSLLDHSLTYKYSFANGGKSIDGLPSITASIPSLKYSFVLSHYSMNKTNSLASTLSSKGYHTSFFHGAPNGSMGFLAFTQVNGFKEYYGKTEYNNDADFDGLWGIWDHKFFNFWADKLNTFQEPFMSTLFSVSSHQPYKVPKEFEGRFPKGNINMHQVIGYTDYALKEFFAKVSKMPWYKNTLFVMTADHTNHSEHTEYQTSIGHYEVPIVFFDPSGELKGYSDNVAQQIDIMPTVLEHLNYDQPYVAFGNNLLSDNEDHFAINANSSVYQLVWRDYLLQYNGEKATGLYKFKSDRLLKNNLVDQNEGIQTEILIKAKAVVQQYNNRLIDNNMVPKE